MNYNLKEGDQIKMLTQKLHLFEQENKVLRNALQEKSTVN